MHFYKTLLFHYALFQKAEPNSPLMDRVDKYKRIEDDQQQGKGKAKVVPQERRDFRSDRYNNNWLRRDYAE